jgi:Pyruvate/2-oxoacid:ferredoxin oxidoreductase delta subunit
MVIPLISPLLTITPIHAITKPEVSRTKTIKCRFCMKTIDRMTTTNGNRHAAPQAKKTKKSKGFRFQIEHCPDQNIIIVHTMKKFPKAETDPLMSSFDKTERKGNQHPLIKSIRRIKGVLKVSSDKFQLYVEKAELFQWDEILPKVRRALKEHFADGMELDEIPAHKPSADYLMALRLQGCDV